MEEQLISFNTAELAKEKGFNFGQSKAYYNHGETELLLWVWSEDHNDQKDLLAYAPTQSLLQRWLREIHNIDITVMIMGQSQYEYYIHQKRILKHNNDVRPESSEEVKYLYEKTLELALQKALELIK